MSRRLAHVPALDGVRGLAVVAVLLFHGGVGWARRIRRLLPALLALLLLVCAYAALLATPDARSRLRLDAIATLGYAANWRLAASGTGYFDRLALPSPLQHTWSLAIEEQFYLLWPVVVVWVLARGRRPLRRLLVIATAAAAASALAMALLYPGGGDPSRVYYGTDTRAQSVLLGVALALLARRCRRATRRCPAALGTSPVGPRGGRRSRRRVHRLGLDRRNRRLAVALPRRFPRLRHRGAAVLADAVLVPEGLLARLLSMEPLQALGRISYGLYLWHWPIFLAVNGERTSLRGPVLLAVRLALTAAVSVVSFRFLELPVRRGVFRSWRAALVLPATAAATLAAVLLVTAVPSPPAPPAVSALGPDVEPSRAATASPGLPTRHRSPGSPVRVLLLGDSVALTLAQGLPASEYGVELVDRAVLGCGVVRGGPFRYFGAQYDARRRCQDWPRVWAADVAATSPDVVAVLLGRWEVMDRSFAGHWTHLGDPAFDAYLSSELDRAVTVLGCRRTGSAADCALLQARGTARRRPLARG